MGLEIYNFHIQNLVVKTLEILLKIVLKISAFRELLVLIELVFQ